MVPCSDGPDETLISPRTPNKLITPPLFPNYDDLFTFAHNHTIFKSLLLILSLSHESFLVNLVKFLGIFFSLVDNCLLWLKFINSNWVFRSGPFRSKHTVSFQDFCSFRFLSFFMSRIMQLKFFCEITSRLL